MRDSAGNRITVCNMENLDPVGVHTGDSIVVAPSQTLADKEYQMLRTAALNIIDALGIVGGCNVQFALNPHSAQYVVIEVNPRVSPLFRAGFQGDRLSHRQSCGQDCAGLYAGRNQELRHRQDLCLPLSRRWTTSSSRSRSWPFDKFVTARRTLGTQMKATGEVMAIASTFEGGLMKAVRSLEQNVESLHLPVIDEMD